MYAKHVHIYIVVFIVVVMFTNMGQDGDGDVLLKCAASMWSTVYTAPNVNKCCFQLDMLLCIRYRNAYDVDNNTSGVEEGSQWGKSKKSLESPLALQPSPDCWIYCTIETKHSLPYAHACFHLLYSKC